MANASLFLHTSFLLRSRKYQLIDGKKWPSRVVPQMCIRDSNVIKKSGSWFSYGDSKLGQGRETVKQMIMDNPELAEELRLKIVAAMTGSEYLSLIHISSNLSNI